MQEHHNIISLLSCSHFSGITLMGVPSEVYYHGTIYWLVNVSSVIVAVVINYVYLPVFYNLQLTSSYEVSYTSQQN
jgi:Na+/proline symporter